MASPSAPAVSVPPLEPGEPAARLDRFLRRSLPTWTNAQRDAALNGRKVRVNGRVVWLASWSVEPGDLVTVEDPPDVPAAIMRQDAWVLLETDDLLVVDKPSGLRSEPRSGADRTDLQSLARTARGDDRLSLAHRLDRDTSGIVVLTRPGALRAQIDAAFKAHQVTKRYVALVAPGAPLPDQGTIRARLGADPQHRDRRIVVERGGESAVTDFEVTERGPDATVVELRPLTGRTHQLRVHLAHLGAPIMGDRLYGSQTSAPRLMLHSSHLAIATLDLRFDAPPGAGFRA